MQLKIQNIGKIKDADITIDGITVIAGENNTGKSTVGKVLFSIFNSFYNIDEQVRQYRYDTVEHIIDMQFFDKGRMSGPDSREFAKHIVDAVPHNATDSLQVFEGASDDGHIPPLEVETLDRIKEVLRVSNDDIFKAVLSKKLAVEFQGQVNNIFTDEPGTVSLMIKGKWLNVEIREEKVTGIDDKISLKTESIYIDDPFVIDSISTRYSFISSSLSNHQQHLKLKISRKSKDENVISEILTENKLSSIFKQLNQVCAGEFVQKGRGGFGYRQNESEKILDIKNLSTGLKAFAILKILLMNGTIGYNGALILDEPEIHLHPEWQLIFAELIVLMQKEFNLHILLNTHSPYFLNAIEVYSAKHGISDKCKYYLAENQESTASIRDVSQCIEEIYAKLARPLQTLENLRWQDD